MLPLCRAEGIGVIPWSPLARGRLDARLGREHRRGPRPTTSARRSTPRPPTPTARWSRRWPRSRRGSACRARRWRWPGCCRSPRSRRRSSARPGWSSSTTPWPRSSLAARARGDRRARGAVRAARGRRPHLTGGAPVVLEHSRPGGARGGVNRSLGAGGTGHSARRRCFPKLTHHRIVSETERSPACLHPPSSRNRNEPEVHTLLSPSSPPPWRPPPAARSPPTRAAGPSRAEVKASVLEARANGQLQPAGEATQPFASRRRRARRSPTARCATRRSPAPRASSSLPAKARRTWPRPARRWRGPTSRKRRARRA